MENLKKILVLAYFFPPSNFAGSYRVYSWAKYFHGYGYYPIIVTRKWEEDIATFRDMSRSTTSEIVHEKNDDYEVFYLPYKGNLRDRIYMKYGESRLVWLRKLLSFFEIFLQNYIISVIPFRNLYDFLRVYLKENVDISFLITSGKPYILFKFCYMLNKEFGINWIADYRDEWSTHQWYKDYDFFKKLFNKIESKREKKWVSSSLFITSVSEYWTKRIANLVNKDGYVIMNGYDEDDFKNNKKEELFKEFTITYNGTLYYSQNIDYFLQAFKNIVNKYAEKIKVRIYFIGLSIDNVRANEVRKSLRGFEDNYFITDRIPKDQVISIQNRSHILLMIGHEEVKGWHSSKIFEYLACSKPIILCPSDNDVMQELIESTNSGFICNNEREVYDKLEALINEYLSAGELKILSNFDEIRKYSRRVQTEKFAGILNKTALFADSIELFYKRKEKINIREAVFKTCYYINLNKTIIRAHNLHRKITILCFHGISDQHNAAYPPLRIDHFERILKYINKHFHVIILSEIDKEYSGEKPLMVITFDDGYKDFIDNALPLLVKHNLPATQNIIVECADTGLPFWTQRLNNILNYIYLTKADYIFKHNEFEIRFDKKHRFDHFNQRILKLLLGYNNDERLSIIKSLESEFPEYHKKGINMMNWEDLRECINNNVEIGSHSLTHDSLVTIQDDKTLYEEIKGSKQIIFDNLNVEVETFTFPNGLYNENIVNICVDSGYRYLLSTNEHFLKRNEINGQDHLIIPRISVDKKSYYENVFKIHNFHNIL